MNNNIYRKAAQRNRVKPGSSQSDAPEAAETALEAQNVVTPVEPQKPVSEAVEAESATLEDLLGELGTEKQPTKSSTTLYLSDDVQAELLKRSKKAKFRSRSEYLDELLRKLFKL